MTAPMTNPLRLKEPQLHLVAISRAVILQFGPCFSRPSRRENNDIKIAPT
jgi:hypothetical protein